jgi:predicted AlkP superfamily pyrophosphatase or phosphodiesterase
MFKKLLFLFLVLVKYSYAQEVEAPRLLLGIVVDQMRNDYLEKFKDNFGEDGFKRLMNEGYYAGNTHYHYKPTYTGPGHASIYTGATPSLHGIVANSWYSKEEGKMVYCVEPIKSENKEAEQEYGPWRLGVSTISDQLKQANNFKSKSYAVALKDRGAILPAGYLADAAFWFNGKEGKWQSSSFYPQATPKWLSAWDKKDLNNTYLRRGWDLSYPLSSYTGSLPDSTAFEYSPFGGRTYFPYDLKKSFKQKGYDILKTLPQGNQLTADFAMDLIEQESLGKDDVLDFLSISFSATDYIGHSFGVQSVELHDTYIKLDQTLAQLLHFLDEKVGKGKYVLFLTADHGAGMPRAWLQQNHIPSGRIYPDSLTLKLERMLDRGWGEEKWIDALTNLNVYFNEESLKKYWIERDKILESCITLLEKEKGIAKAQVTNYLEQYNDPISKMLARGVKNNCSGEIVLTELPNYTVYSDKGSTHGSPYQYDTHVPLLFYGGGIKPGKSFTYQTISDIVPTLCALLSIPLPEGSLGEPISCF